MNENTPSPPAPPPLPILGSGATKPPVGRQGKTLRIASVTALILSVLGIVGFISALIVGYAFISAPEAQRYSTVGVIAASSHLSAIVGVGIGIYARRTRVGKAAIIVGLSPFALIGIAMVVSLFR